MGYPQAQTKVAAMVQPPRAPLTTEHAAFCDAYVHLGGNGTQAYLTVYPNAANETAQVNASKLIRVPEVADRIMAIAAIAKDKAQLLYPSGSVTAERAIARLADIGLGDGHRDRDAVQAIATLGKLAGWIVERHVIDVTAVAAMAERDGLSIEQRQAVEAEFRAIVEDSSKA